VRQAMLDDILGGGVTLVILVYLVIALIRPERF
jgi:K+-transporting ATPase KdpF subunit